MSAVRNWLEEIGLAQYADAFEANDIDTDLLTQIDDQVLKDIGVSTLPLPSPARADLCPVQCPCDSRAAAQRLSRPRVGEFCISALPRQRPGHATLGPILESPRLDFIRRCE
jgi:hypothetical protein